MSEFKPVENPAAVFELDTPIQYLGDEIRSIAIRAPTAGDIFRAGNPVIAFDFETGEWRHDEKKALTMLSLLSGIAIQGSLDRMQAEDAIACFDGMGPFFVKGLRKVLKAFRESREQDIRSSLKPDAQPAS